MKIAVAGTGYVGLSVALLLSQHNEVHALDIVPEKVELLNNCQSPMVDTEITRFLDGKRDGTMDLDFQATLDPAVAAPAARQTDRPPALPEAGWPVLEAAAWTPVPVRFPRAHRPKTRVPAFALLSPDRPVGRKSVRPKDLPGWSAEFQFRGIFDRKP